jgi:hypothetical protein
MIKFQIDPSENTLCPSVAMILCKKRYVLECSMDKKNYFRVHVGRGNNVLDLLPQIRFYRLRRYGPGKYPLKVMVKMVPSTSTGARS